MLLVLCGNVYNKLCETEKAKECQGKALCSTEEFDGAPNYTSQNIRYCINAELREACDNIGSTAMGSILKPLEEDVDGSDESVLKL